MAKANIKQSSYLFRRHVRGLCRVWWIFCLLRAMDQSASTFLYLRFRLLRLSFCLRLILGLSLWLENVINQLRDPAKGTFEPPAQTSGTSPRLRHNGLARAAQKKQATVIITAAQQDTFMWGEEDENKQL